MVVVVNTQALLQQTASKEFLCNRSRVKHDTAQQFESEEDSRMSSVAVRRSKRATTNTVKLVMHIAKSLR